MSIGNIFFWMFQWIYSKVLRLTYNGAPRTIPTIKNSILLESASSLANRIRKQKVTSVEVVQSYINRVQEINDVLNCVTDERFEEALAEAKKVDELIRSGTKTPKELEAETPFLGVPFTTPDSVAVKGLLNTMGLWSRKNARAEEDACIVSLMREGGAIPLACTNVSESCFLWETNNPVFGRTCNPYDTNRSVGGPFGGEGCLIAASGSPLGIAPSVRLPCAFTGIFGHNPSTKACGEVAGPMSRNSEDLLPALKVLTKHSKSDLRLDHPVDVTKLKYYFIDLDDRETPISSLDKEIKQAIQKTIDHFRNIHNAAVERIGLKKMHNALSIKKAKAKELQHRKTALGKVGNINFRTELIKALFGKSRHTLLFLLTALAEEKMFPCKSSDQKEAEEDCTELLTNLENWLGSDGVLVYPTHSTAAFRHNESLIVRFNQDYAANLEGLGLPATHCPAGLNSEGLPVGFQIVAAMNQDRLTLAIAREIDRIFGGWKPPPTHGTFTLKNTVFYNLFNEKIKTL